MRFFWMASRVAFYGLLVMFAVAVATRLLPSWNDGPRPQVGCYWTNAMIVFVTCRGFAGDSIVAFLLNTPWVLFFYGPLFLHHYVTEGQFLKFVNEGLVLQAFAMLAYLSAYLVWLILGLLYPFRWAYLKLRARRSEGSRLAAPEED